MNYDPRLWKFIADMNYDGYVTISDVWLWFKWLFFLPGDFALKFTIIKIEGLAIFFEISFADYGGFLSGIISFVFWLVCYLLYWGIKEQIIDLKEDIMSEKKREKEESQDDDLN